MLVCLIYFRCLFERCVFTSDIIEKVSPAGRQYLQVNLSDPNSFSIIFIERAHIQEDRSLAATVNCWQLFKVQLQTWVKQKLIKGNWPPTFSEVRHKYPIYPISYEIFIYQIISNDTWLTIIIIYKYFVFSSTFYIWNIWTINNNTNKLWSSACLERAVMLCRNMWSFYDIWFIKITLGIIKTPIVEEKILVKFVLALMSQQKCCLALMSQQNLLLLW